MTFTPHKFSRRFPEVECAILVLHEKPFKAGPGASKEYIDYGVSYYYRATAVAIVTMAG